MVKTAALSLPLLDRVNTPADLRALPEADLAALAAELRAFTIQLVEQTGGHMGAGLGVVELTIALHRLYNTPTDLLLWDVGHQAYPHKILTGRKAAMATLRQPGGLSGFTKREESPYDPFGAGHSSTSLSAAMGMAEASRLHGNTSAQTVAPQVVAPQVVAVIGDGALTAGMAWEALNNIGGQQTPMLIILNDNGMSIAPNVGALPSHLQRLASGTSPNNLFRALGLTYKGPVDGHDMPELLAALATAKDLSRNGPVVLHVLTEKGRGWHKAVGCPEKGHAAKPLAPEKLEATPPPVTPPSYTQIFADTLVKLATQDSAIVGITAAMPSGTGMSQFAAAFPTRTYDTGIAEQHAVTFAAGLATQGLKPFTAIYSTFLQRAYDQVIHDVALQNLPVRFILDRAGLVGADGPTHHGVFDIAYLSAIPNLTLLAPADGAELVHMLATAAAHNDGPTVLRFPRGSGENVALPEAPSILPIGQGRIVRQDDPAGGDIAFLTLGPRLYEALAAAKTLAAAGYTVTVADARFAKPLDAALLTKLATTHRALITAEEGGPGGFGATVLAALASQQLHLPIATLQLGDQFIEQAPPASQYAAAGLDAAGMVAAAKRLLPR